MSVAKQGAKTAVPKLRFPEFRQAPSWKSYALIELADERVKWSFAGGPFGSNLKASDYTSDGVRIIQLQNIGDGEFLTDYRIYTSASKADDLLSSNIYPGELLLSKMGDPVGRACIVPDNQERYVMCSDGIRLAVDARKFSRDFAFFAINFDGFRRRVEAAATGSTRKRIGLDTLKQLSLDVPALPEQQRIAECLTSLDEVIAAQARKVEALKAHKRGLMQQLFPREGETRPRLRFPEFRDAPEWEQHRLGDIASISKGKGISKADIAAEGRTPCIRYGELYTVYGEVIDRPLSRTDVPAAELVLSQAGDVLVPASGETKEDIATSAVVLGAGVALGGDLNIIRLDADGRFFSYYLNGAKRRALAKVAQGDTVVHLYPRQLEQLDVAIPVDKAEQQRIADCLSSLDTRITAETHQLATLKTHKQGLMQQLFPAPDTASA